MRWEDERYVRLYTRDTGTWIAVGFEGRHVLMSLLRKVDRAGVLDVLDGREAEELAAIISAPIEIVRTGLVNLINRGVVVVGGGQLRMPRFLDAQECRTSDKERQRKSRELAALGHTLSHAVTGGHNMSLLAVPSLAVPSRIKTLVAKKPATPVDPRLTPLTEALVSDYENIRGTKYKHGGVKDALAVKSLLSVGSDIEIRRRWILGLEATGWSSCSTLAQLGSKWNDLKAPSQSFDPNQGIIIR